MGRILSAKEMIRREKVHSGEKKRLGGRGTGGGGREGGKHHSQTQETLRRVAQEGVARPWEPHTRLRAGLRKKPTE